MTNTNQGTSDWYTRTAMNVYLGERSVHTRREGFAVRISRITI